MPPIHLLIKPASGNCNLRCKYCFYYDLTEKREIPSYGIMTVDTLEAVIKKTLATAEGQCTIAYQGGEPTLAGLSFFQKSVEFQNKYNVNNIEIHNAIQTNGYAIDGAWADFFAKNHFLVGVSLDGTSAVHDFLRVDPKGNGSYSRVMKNIMMLREHKVDFNILTTVHGFNAKKIREIYRFFKAKQFDYLQFIPCLDPFEKENGKERHSLTPAVYGEFLCNLFDLWYDDIVAGNTVHIRHFENYIEMLLGYPPESCGMSGICSYQHVVEADGAIYPCDFYVTDRYKIGNVVTDSFDQLQQQRFEIGFIEESKAIDPACQECPYFGLCRGGCKRYRLTNEDGSLGLNYYCESYKRFFEYTGTRLQQLARAFSRG